MNAYTYAEIRNRIATLASALDCAEFEPTRRRLLARREKLIRDLEAVRPRYRIITPINPHEEA